jgi:hypothetical protein
LLTGMSCSHLIDTQGVGVQCVAYICRWIVSCPGIMVCSMGFSPAFFQLPSSCTGLLPPKSWLLSCPMMSLLGQAFSLKWSLYCETAGLFRQSYWLKQNVSNECILKFGASLCIYQTSTS